MTSTKRKFIILNSLNLVTIVLMFVGYLLIIIPAASYFHAKSSVFFVSSVLGIVAINIFIAFLCMVISIAKHHYRMIAISAFMISLIIFMFTTKYYYPWARYSIHFPTPKDVCWRESAIFNVKDDFARFIKKNQGLVPVEEKWKELLIKEGYNFNNTLNTWNRTFNSSILVNQNIRGMKLKDLDGQTVFLFEGLKNTSFGSKAALMKFADKNQYVYVVLVNGCSGRINMKSGKVESLFGGLTNNDVPLKWK